jgi:hypothetical protein
MKHFLALFALFIVCFSCSPEPGVNPLEAARQKLEQANSISFEMQSVWNNTFVGDTALNASHKGIYLRNDQRDFPYDFIYEADGTSSLYLQRDTRGRSA